MNFLRLLNEVSTQPVSARHREPWTAPLLEAGEHFGDLVLIGRQGVVDPAQAGAFLNARFDSYQPNNEWRH